MAEKKRRARTGCLTCRARHVKCDEQRPKCRRCIGANVECSGYEKQRVVVPVEPLGRRRRTSSTGRSGTQEESQVTPPSRHGSDAVATPSRTPKGKPASMPILDDRHPLADLFSNPRLDQRPCLGARHVLGYNQVLLRTVPILFSSTHWGFWREELFQEAWDCSYLYLALVALGNMHRVALMATSTDAQEQAPRLDLKITAVRTYTEALNELSVNLKEAQKAPVLLVATLCLMAYFESFSGNIPAFIGRVHSADHYFKALILGDLDSASQAQGRIAAAQALDSCIHSLKWTCSLIVPLRLMYDSESRSIRRHRRGWRSDIPKDSKDSPPDSVLQSLIDLVSAHPDVSDLLWNPIAPYARLHAAPAIYRFEAELQKWRDHYLHLIPELDTDSALETLLLYKWQRFSFPPPAYDSTSRCSSLAAAHYNYYAGRVKWALLLLGHDTGENHLAADFHFYEALRHTGALVPRHRAVDQGDNAYIPSEAVNVGLAVLLHNIGLCSPQPIWIEWIQALCEEIVQEGVSKALAFAKHLDCLHKLELHLHADSQSVIEQYPPTGRRIISILIPEADGRHFISYFAAPESGADAQREGLGAYRVMAHARWECNHGENPLPPHVTIYPENSSALEVFSTDWVYRTRPAQEWIAWSEPREFRIDRALHDHISGTRLLFIPDEASGETQGSITQDQL